MVRELTNLVLIPSEVRVVSIVELTLMVDDSEQLVLIKRRWSQNAKEARYVRTAGTGGDRWVVRLSSNSPVVFLLCVRHVKSGVGRHVEDLGETDTGGDLRGSGFVVRGLLETLYGGGSDG